MTTSPENILIVDDRPDSLRLLFDLLSAQGYAVRPATDGASALIAATNAPPDLVLLDVQMPGLDGFAVCAALKADPRTCEVPVLFLSAADAVLDKVRAFAVGGVDYITKPFQPEEVLARVRAQLTQRRAERLIRQQQETLATLRERERLARELHDSLGQMLGAVSAHAQAGIEQLARGQHDALARALHTIQANARDALVDVREFILGVKLGPQSRQDEPIRGIRYLLERYLDEFSRLAGILVSLHCEVELVEELLTPAVEVQVLRILQEALSNVRKHALAQEVALILRRDAHTLYLTLRDNGRGFAMTQADNGTSYGLSSMRDRAREIGASLQIASAPGVGTTVELHVPLGVPSVQTMTFLLVDDHPLFLEGMQSLLRAHGLRVVGLARNGEEAVAQAMMLRPDVVLMDIEMPRLDGIAATRQLVAALPGLRVVMLTAAADDTRMREALGAGATGFLLKDLDAQELLRLLEQVSRGESPLAPRLVTQLLGNMAQKAGHALPQPHPPQQTHLVANGSKPALNERQEEVLELLAAGLTYKEIASRLMLSERTVRYHVEEILKRLGLTSRAEAITYAAQRQRPTAS